MTVTSILRTGLIALALGTSVASALPAFANSEAKQSQQLQNANTGVYDGAAWEAAKNAPND